MSENASRFRGIKAIDLSRDFFDQAVLPAMCRACPDLLPLAACGKFGYGSECLGMDDQISQDHHWGPRVDILLPEDVYQRDGQRFLRDVGAALPRQFAGFELGAGHVGAAGLALESLEGLLRRTIGRVTPPVTPHDWLDLPEEDITHIVNGQVWRDPAGQFTAIRTALNAYYPDAVWKRRIAHWCRYASGMGAYAVQRALLRENWHYAHCAFGRLSRLTLELVFLLNRRYYPYDKWLYPMFKTLPELAPKMVRLIDEACAPPTPWLRRLRLFEDAHDLIDQHMVAMGLIPEHPRFARSQTSGYRVLEHAYGHLCRTLPADVRSYVPRWDQEFLEEFHTAFVAGVPGEDWDQMLNLRAKPR